MKKWSKILISVFLVVMVVSVSGCVGTNTSKTSQKSSGEHNNISGNVSNNTKTTSTVNNNQINTTEKPKSSDNTQTGTTTSNNKNQTSENNQNNNGQTTSTNKYSEVKYEFTKENSDKPIIKDIDVKLIDIYKDNDVVGTFGVLHVDMNVGTKVFFFKYDGSNQIEKDIWKGNVIKVTFKPVKKAKIKVNTLVSITTEYVLDDSKSDEIVVSPEIINNIITYENVDNDVKSFVNKYINITVSNITYTYQRGNEFIFSRVVPTIHNALSVNINWGNKPLTISVLVDVSKFLTNNISSDLVRTNVTSGTVVLDNYVKISYQTYGSFHIDRVYLSEPPRYVPIPNQTLGLPPKDNYKFVIVIKYHMKTKPTILENYVVKEPTDIKGSDEIKVPYDNGTIYDGAVTLVLNGTKGKTYYTELWMSDPDYHKYLKFDVILTTLKYEIINYEKPYPQLTSIKEEKVDNRTTRYIITFNNQSHKNIEDFILNDLDTRVYLFSNITKKYSIYTGKRLPMMYSPVVLLSNKPVSENLEEIRDMIEGKKSVGTDMVLLDPTFDGYFSMFGVELGNFRSIGVLQTKPNITTYSYLNVIPLLRDFKYMYIIRGHTMRSNPPIDNPFEPIPIIQISLKKDVNTTLKEMWNTLLFYRDGSVVGIWHNFSPVYSKVKVSGLKEIKTTGVPNYPIDVDKITGTHFNQATWFEITNMTAIITVMDNVPVFVCTIDPYYNNYLYNPFPIVALVDYIPSWTR